jgi:hypothetical protein
MLIKDNYLPGSLFLFTLPESKSSQRIVPMDPNSDDSIGTFRNYSVLFETKRPMKSTTINQEYKRFMNKLRGDIEPSSGRPAGAFAGKIRSTVNHISG